MSLTVAPSTSFEASIDVGTTGLVGTLAIGIYEGSTDVAHTALATTTINEIGTTGLYVATRTAPATAGQYLIVWSLDGTLTPAQLATEDLLVTSSPAYAAPSGTAYVSAATLKTTLSLTGETFADADLAVAVEAASRMIDQACDRRFYLDADATSVRHYTPSNHGLVSIDDLVAVTNVKTDTGADYSWATTLTVNTDYLLAPFNAADDGWPYTRLKANTNGGYTFEQRPRWVQVTGQFGWPAVPAAIVQATTIMASRLMKRAREAPLGTIGFGVDGAVVRVQRVDPDVEALIAPYRRLGVG